MKKFMILCFFTVCVAMAPANVFEKTMGFEGDTLVKNMVEYSKYGITDIFLKEFNNNTGRNYQVRTLTKVQAEEVYQYIWDKNRLGEITDTRVAQSIFDWIFNNGNSAIIDIQRSVNYKLRKHGYTKRISEDYSIGPETIRYINTVIRIDKNNFLRLLTRNRLNKYKSFKHWDHFGRGWKRRIKAF